MSFLFDKFLKHEFMCLCNVEQGYRRLANRFNDLVCKMSFNDDHLDVMNKITTYFVCHKINSIFMWYVKSINNHPDFNYLTEKPCPDFDYKFFKKTNQNYFKKEKKIIKKEKKNNNKFK